MDDASKQPQSFGSGQQRNQHPRPFFYVQPPSQPYYLYPQWQLNNPYSHFGLPGAFNFGRPCMHPYQYMQYPGFVLPHAPIYPMDYRRMFEPRFHAPVWGDVPRQQQHHYHPQPHGRRETACSEAQTDPSDAITKLIECLDKIRANELQGTERELDSGIASQSSGMFSPEEEKKNEEQSHILPSESSTVTFGESTAADESSQIILDTLSAQGCWAGRLEEELPLDSSSVHEECPEGKRSAADDGFLHLGKEEVMDIQSDVSVTDQSAPRCDTEEPCNSIPASLAFSSIQPSLKEPKNSDHVSKVEHPAVSLDEAQADRSYRILKLPFDDVLTPGSAGPGHLCSPTAPYYYNYLSMQPTHERMSVLSPSLDELSSRDEMFSTDLDDVDLFPQHMYTGRRLTEVIGGSPCAAEDVEEMWRPGTKRFVCACCGKSLAKGMGRSKVHSSKMYMDEAGDSEDEGRYGRGCEQPIRVVVRKHSSPRKTHPLPQRHAAKSWHKRGLYKESVDAVDQDEERDGCKQELGEGEAGDVDSSELQCRTCQERLCREDLTDGDVIPRRRREMSAQWKVMYHRPRDEARGDDELPPHWDRDMEAATSTLQHLHSLGPRGPNPLTAAQPSQGPQQPAPGASAAPRPEEQQHKPFFYIQPSQPYMPMQSLQWPVPVPMPMSYNPYYGYPGLGFGIPLMPHYQPNPYMEPPGFVVPHTHLHLMDYRRMLNPQYYQTMAYHARRLRYQHNSTTREMTSSEVQTEPLSVTQNTNTPNSRDMASSSVFPINSSSSSSTSVSNRVPSSALTVQNSPESNDMAPSSTIRTPSNGSFVIQTEEVRIECCTTPVGLQLLHAHETTEVSHSFSQDMVQCSSILQGRVLQEEGLCLPADQSEQTLQVCPDILLVGTPSTGETMPTPDESGNQMVPVVSSLGSQEAVCEEAGVKSEREQSMTTSPQLKVVHLPFNTSYLDELRKMESSVWSVEDTLVPSSESLIQNGPAESFEETLTTTEVTSAEMILEEEAPPEDGTAMTDIPQLEEDDLGVVPTVQDVGDEMVVEGDICPMMDEAVLEEPSKPTLMHTEMAVVSNMQQLENSPLKADRSQSRTESSVQDCQDTSFESLPAYLPSTNWLADFDNIYYCNKLPQAPKKQTQPRCLDVSARRRKLDLEYKELNIRKPKEKYKPKGKADRRSLSDHECCLGRSFNENVFSTRVPKRERLCSRCLTKHTNCMSASPGLEGRSLKRKVVPFQQWNDAPLPTCDACKSHTKRRLRKSSNPDLCSPRRGPDTEGESSENSSYRKGQRWRPGDDPRKLTDLKRPLACKQNLERSPAAMYPKLREKNFVCNELQHQPVAWERLHHCTHGNAIREMDENSALPLQDNWRNVDQRYLMHRWQTEKSWMPKSDTDGSKNETRSQHLNKHKKSQPQSQGTRTRDTRC